MPKSRKRKSGKGGVSSRYTYSSNRKSQKRTKLIQTFTVAALVIAGLAAAIAVYLSLSNGDSTPIGVETTTSSGLKYVDVVAGTGESPEMGRTVTVHYTGRLENGEKFESSRDKGQPYTFTLGRDPVIEGWVEGLMSMKVGGRRNLIIPPDLGYGERGNPPVIPPNSTLLFDLELLAIK